MLRKSRLGVVCALLLTLTACATQQTGSRSSVVSYLYPDKAVPHTTTTIPQLSLPLRMGIAFVPGASSNRNSSAMPWVEVQSNPLTENHKAQMLNAIAGHFSAQPFVGHIEVIPSAYLTAGGSFANLDQLKAMFNIDVIALVSYDQLQFTDDSKLSLSYWTLVGAYLVAGQKNDTNTLMDTAVYAIDSRKLLFRAPGISQLKGRSTPVDLQKELRQDSLQGFLQANGDMIKNLEIQLQQFKQQLQQNPESVKLSYKSGYGGGSSGVGVILLLLLCLGLKASANTSQRQAATRRQ